MSESLSPQPTVVIDGVNELLSLAKARAAFMQSEVCRHCDNERNQEKNLEWTRKQIVEYYESYRAAVDLLRTCGFQVEVNDPETRDALHHAEALNRSKLPY